MQVIHFMADASSDLTMSSCVTPLAIRSMASSMRVSLDVAASFTSERHNHYLYEYTTAADQEELAHLVRSLQASE